MHFAEQYTAFIYYSLPLFREQNENGRNMQQLELIKNDPWLEPYKKFIEGRFNYAVSKEASLTHGGKQTLSEFASGYMYFGLHRTPSGWVFREWAPNATAI